ncbi:MAG TPA: TetR/AcrR family transcriptional regulator [Stellaceae bacterium]|nr:TetR/AcrR family transcriptional regulator [Stellaceae bacterium]
MTTRSPRGNVVKLKAGEKVAKADAASPPSAADAAAPEGEAKPARRQRGRPRLGDAVARELPRDEEILRIAANVLYKKGFDEARLDDIAREAGIVKGSLYHYFSSKEEIYERLVSNVRGRINFEEEVKGKAPADDRLTHLLRTRLETTVEYPLEILLLTRALVRIPGPVGDWARADPKRYFVAIRQIIIQGQKEGKFRAVDPDIIASVIIGILAHLPTWYRLGGRIRPDALVDELLDFIMMALKPAKPQG